MFRNIMLVAVAAMACASCAKDITADEAISVNDGKQLKGNVSLSFTADLDATKTTYADGKLSWAATDEIGVVVKGAEASDINLKAITTEEKCATGSFFTDGGTQTAGKMFAYYPFNDCNDPELDGNKRASVALSEKSMWVIIPQGQMQSKVNEAEFGSYLPMAAGPVDLTDGAKPKLEFKALGSVICFDIYDTSAKYNGEKVLSVTAVAEGGTDDMLVGGTRYDLAENAWDHTVGGKRYGAIVNLGEEFAVPAAAGAGKVYMAVFAGNHTLKVTVRTDKGAHVFHLTAQQNSTVGKIGTVKLNLGNANTEHYYLYQPYDLCIWGADMMYQKSVFWYPNYDETSGGKVASTTQNGEEPWLFVGTDFNADGTSSWAEYTGEDPVVAAAHEHLLLSRGLTGWVYDRCYEHPGYVKCGSSSAGYAITTPALAGLKPEGENVEFSFDCARRYGCTDKVVIEILGEGTINGNTSKTIDPEVPDSKETVKDKVANYKFNIFGANNETKIKVRNEGTAASMARIQFDNFIVKAVAGPVQLPAVDFNSIKRTFTAEKGVLTWNAVEGADIYNVVIKQDGATIAAGDCDAAELEVTGWSANTTYTIELRSNSTNTAAYLPSEWITVKIAYDSKASGTELFFENFDWITQDVVGSGTEAICQDGATGSTKAVQEHGYSVPTNMRYGGSGGLSNRVYARVGMIKMGRSANAEGSNGEFFLPMDKVFKDVADGAQMDLIIKAKTCRYSASEKQLFVVLDVDGNVTATEYNPTTASSEPTAELWDEGLSIELKNVRRDSKICLSTAWLSGSTKNRVFFDDIQILKK